MSFLELHDIRKAYTLNHQENVILKGINLNFERGEFISILGESGGGKSTLMNIIGGLDHQYDGDVLLDGQSLRSMNVRQMDRYRRETIGFIFQNFNLVSYLTVLDNVMLSLKMTKTSHAQQVQQAQDLLKRVGLEQQTHQYPNELSGGQKQRVAIARALASDPDIIIADEPTGALDSENTQEVMDILYSIAAEGKLVITVTHSQEVADYGTRIVHLDDGQIHDELVIGAPFDVVDKQPTRYRTLGFRQMFRMSMQHMRRMWLRYLLIIFGSSIGISSIVVMLGLGSGIQNYMNHQITSQVNPTAVQVSKKTGKVSTAARKKATSAAAYKAAVNQEQVTAAKNAEVTTANVKQLAAIKHVKSAKLGYYTSTQASYKKTTVTASLQTDNPTILSKTIKDGSRPENGQVLIGRKLAKKMVGKKNYQQALNKKLTVKLATVNRKNQSVTVSQTLTVSGITGSDDTSVVVLPQTVKKMLTAKNVAYRPNFAIVQIDKLANVKQVEHQIKAIKGTNKKQQYNYTGIGDLIDSLNTYIRLATNVLTGVAGIALLVSAIMIIVVLYVSVSERTREIGVLRALGARKRDISHLFFAEALTIGVLAAVMGLLFGEGWQFLGNMAIYSLIKYPIVRISGAAMLGGITVSVVISLLAALAPAHMAARLDPVESLSHE
ncbi:ATP-binding cassette domain-containing protein [Lactiplantibacillus plantarum]|uniref:ABC transporter, ATP-binding and permease protein n=1 Tax=Lactiplantibacillus plantarum (strain ATCC BAA-793 / NCIMB 8826 / WCFS1) TaxID=220668 RepID=F9UR30_LACPL|nr:ABC transporter ATP-binding protein/permease [Lactiplantibacillus plantarum]MDE4416240.1 ABC transporter ATP-binding protein [Lactiplantibacillus plantarum]MDE4419280.1 ABC transporter ATP-binding protein [Lactiplantibacillus plantarum]MDE4422548.1 ABC transporter ATP-binding protein [Lactiplantibacillus plantarum]MDE4424943.1 ABC transporter ATP-binding protein [Lactiplantibacillus plantarum]MDE4428730.1 ABC transporter ATP-binding protein [Lactiplantibacillus plantarum]